MTKWFFAFVVSLWLVASGSHAEVYLYPDEENAVFGLEIPDDWASEVDDEGGLYALSGDEYSELYVWVVDSEEGMDDAIDALAESIDEEVYDQNIKDPVEKTIGGIDCLLIKGSGVYTEDDEPVKIEAVITSPVNGHALIFYFLYYDGVSAKVRKEMTAIVESLYPVESAADDDAGPVPDPIPEITLEPGQWKPMFEFHEEVIFSSLPVALATFKLDSDPDEEVDPNFFGDDLGMIGVVVRAPKANSKVVVEISCPGFFDASTISAELGKSGEYYRLYPVIKYDYQKLLAVKQTMPANVNFKVKIDGEEKPEVTRRVQVRPINECVFGFVDDQGEPTDLSFLFAAYVNENHPLIDRLLREALDSEDVEMFGGYQGDRDAVIEELSAVWNVLQERGFKYSNITTTSGEGERVFSQHVRLLGDAAETSQANCVDGSVLIASVLRKLGYDVFLVLIPGHMFLGVSLDAEGKEVICIETTMMGSDADFEEAVAAGEEQYAQYEDCFDDEENLECQFISVAAARALGVLPISSGN